jgi:FMN phosphatase YigB (HAD superfamily)
MSLPKLRRLRFAIDTSLLLSRRIGSLSGLERFPGIRTASLITFDVFDTAILRSVSHPDDVFGLSAWRAVNRHGLALDPDRLAAQRKQAHLAALRQQARVGRQEATIAEVYDCHPIEDAAIRALLLAEELATETDVIQPNHPIRDIYLHLRAQGVRLAFLSDTPFSSAFLAGLLAQAGYPGPLEVHVSSEFGATKASGALFPRLADRLGIRTRDIWHIGDNLRSDVLKARRAGINPLWYRPALRKPYRPPIAAASDLARSVMEGARTALTEGGADASSPLRRLGLESSGPACLAFVQWLLRDLSQAPVHRIFLLARDSYILKIFYDRLRATTAAPASTYLFVSRRSLVFPMIDRMGEAELDFLCSHERVLPLQEFVSRLGLDMSRFTASAKAAGLEPGRLIETPADLAALRSVFVAIAPAVIDHARAERVLLLRYLGQEGLFLDQPVAVCDVGWHGSSQKALARIRSAAGIHHPLAGFYIGTEDGIERLGPAEGAAKGWLIDRGLPRIGKDFRRFSWVLMELLFSAPHGSTIGYREEGGVVGPILRDHVGDPAVQHAVGEIQAGAVAFLEAYARAFGGVAPLAVDEALAVSRLARLFRRPRLSEATAIGDLTVIEGLGETRTGFPIAAPPPWRSILARPRSLLASYRQAFWRRAFLMRIVRNWHVAGAIAFLRGG